MGDGARCAPSTRRFAIARGAVPLRPALRLVAAERLSERLRVGVERRLATWLDSHIARVLAPLFEARRAAPDGLVGGLLFRIAEAGGGAAPHPPGDLRRSLGPRGRKVLAAMGVRLGSETVFMPALLEPGPMRLRAPLWCVHNARVRRAARGAGAGAARRRRLLRQRPPAARSTGRAARAAPRNRGRAAHRKLPLSNSIGFKQSDNASSFHQEFSSLL